MKKWLIFLIVLLIGLLVAACDRQPKSPPGSLFFYSSGQGTGQLLFQLPDSPVTYRLPQCDCDAYAIGSIVLKQVHRGGKIILEGEEAIAEIRVLEDCEEYLIGTFEKSYADRFIQIHYQGPGKLDGLVKVIKIK